jgi:hypothetical protein
MIIPGASPSHRVVPGEDATSHAYHTHAPASAYVDGYANGFGQGYGAANAGLTADTAHTSTSYHPDTNHASTSASSTGGSVCGELLGKKLWAPPGVKYEV